MNYNPEYSRIGGIGRRVLEDRLDLVEIKFLYAMPNLASQNNDYEEMQRRYDTLSMVEKQRLLDDFNRRLKRQIRSDPSELFSTPPPPPRQPPGAGASAAVASSADRVPEAPERVEPQMPAGPPTPSLEDTYDAMGPHTFRLPPPHFTLSPRSDLVLPSTAPTSQVSVRDMVAERSFYIWLNNRSGSNLSTAISCSTTS